MPRSLSGQSILVFGGTGGIGSVLCTELVSAGAKVTAANRSEDALQALGEQLGVHTVVADVTEPDAVKAAIDSAAEYHGGLDAIVLAVGSILLRPVHLTKDADFAHTLDINLRAAFHIARAGCKKLMRSGGGSIVFFSTAAAQIGLPNHEAIAAAKAGIEGLTRASAATYAGKGVRVNCVAPGLVKTPLAEPITRNAASLEASRNMHALGRVGEPEDVSHAVRFLLEADWVTGQTLVVDGGLSGIKTA